MFQMTCNLGGKLEWILVMLELYLLILPWWELVFFDDDVNVVIWCNIIWSNELTLLGEGTIMVECHEDEVLHN